MTLFFNIIILVIGKKTLSDFFASLLLNFLDKFFNLIISINDLAVKFWEFGRYDHPYWALIISFFLIYIYFKIYDTA